jgi:hypothetical protein
LAHPDGVWHDGLNHLGLEALPWQDRVIGESFAITNMASLPLATTLQARAATGRQGSMALLTTLAPAAAGNGGLGLGHVGKDQLTSEQRALLTRGYSGGVSGAVQIQPRVGDFLAADLQGTALLHVLAHGAFDSRRELGAGIALEADLARPLGVLWPEDIAGMKNPPRGIVALSACGAGRAPRRVGEDLAANLGGAFLRAGAATVIQSRAQIRRDASISLIATFQDHLGGRDPRPGPAEAMRAARAARARATHGESRYHDAQVQVFGAGW